MRKKEYKGRCEKRILQKCNTVFKSYSPVQSAYANILVKNKDIQGNTQRFLLNENLCFWNICVDALYIAINNNLLLKFHSVSCIIGSHMWGDGAQGKS